MKKEININLNRRFISRSIIQLILFVLFLWSIEGNAQPYPLTHPTADPSPWRGLYVNKFVKFSSSTDAILGIPGKEDDALHFAQDNNFKRLDLTHLDEIFPGHLSDPTPSGNSYENDLCSFMTDARENYCIEEISAVAAAYNFFDDFYNWNTLHFTGPYIFSMSSIPGINTWGSEISYVQNTYTSADGSIALRSEMMKYFLRLLDYNYRNAPPGLGAGAHPCRFDNFTIEYEWWNTPHDWPFFHQLLLDLNTLQHNTNHTFNIHLYTLIRDMPADINNNPHTVQEIADFIDPLVDKIYLTDYPNTVQSGTSNIPDDFWNLNYFRWGMDALRNNTSTNTIITPLFNCLQNNEGIHDWLVDPAHPDHTLFTAEQMFNTLSQVSTNSTLIGDNILTHGSYQWIYYTYFPMITTAPPWPYPYCTNNEVFYVQNQPIACPATNTITACTGDNILFKYISNYEANVSCRWDFGDNTILNVPPGDRTHTFNQPGTYIVSCHLTFPPSNYPNSQSNCEYITFQRTVVVTGAGITANGPITFCQGNSVQLAASSGSSYYWTTPLGNHFTSSTVTGNENGIYTVTVGNSGGCVTSTASIHITINPLPTPSLISPQLAVCSGQNVTYTTQLGNSGYMWQVTGGTSTPSGNTVNVTWGPAGTGHVKINYTDLNGCTATSPTDVTVTINTSMAPFASISSNVGNTMCEGPVTLSASSNGGTGTTFLWSTDGANWGNPGQTYSPTLVPGTYNFYVQMTASGTNCVPTTPTPFGPFHLTVTPYIPLDLFMKDNSIFSVPPALVEDDGTEPSPYGTGVVLANSPDMWVTHFSDPYTHAPDNAEYQNNPNNVWVTVRNRGCVNYTSGAKLHLYWAKSSTALSWPSFWNGCQQTPASVGLSCSNGLTCQPPCLGNEISDAIYGTNGIPIPAILAKSQLNTPVRCIWTVPNSNCFNGCMPSAYEHFCLIARIVYANDPMSYPEGPTVGINTIYNNNIIWKNITVVSTIPPFQSGTCTGDKSVGGVISVGNPYEEAGVFQLDFRVAENYSGKPIFEQAEIKVNLDDKTWDKWAEGGFQGENIKIKREDCKQLVITGSPARLKNLAYDRNNLSLISLSFNFLTDKIDQTPSFLYHVIESKNDNDEDVVGSETYQIGKPSRYLFGAEGGGDKTISYKENILLSATSIGEPAFYNWYDEEGNMVYSGQNFTVSPELTKKYKLEVIAESDGFTSYDSLIVHVKEFEIINLNPNPTVGQLTVEYEARNATSAYLSIVQPYTSASNNYIIDPSLQTTTLNLTGYAPGNYFIRLICDGQIRDEKNLIIIQ